MVVGARLGGLSISEATDHLGYLHAAESRVYTKKQPKILCKIPCRGRGQKRWATLVFTDRKIQ